MLSGVFVRIAVHSRCVTLWCAASGCRRSPGKHQHSEAAGGETPLKLASHTNDLLNHNSLQSLAVSEALPVFLGRQAVLRQ